MTEELLNTVINFYQSEIDENIWFADNLVRQNGYDGRQASIIYHQMFNYNGKVLHNCIDKSRIFYTLLLSKERVHYEEQQKNETII